VKKLSKDQSTRRDAILAGLRAKHEELEKTKDALELARTAFNEKLDEARELAEEVSEAIGNYYDSRSESWQEGDTGEATQSWKAEWENFNSEELDEFDLEDIVDSASERTDEFEALPLEVE